jgi:hypothetical protein
MLHTNLIKAITENPKIYHTVTSSKIITSSKTSLGHHKKIIGDHTVTSSNNYMRKNDVIALKLLPYDAQNP